MTRIYRGTILILFVLIPTSILAQLPSLTYKELIELGREMSSVKFYDSAAIVFEKGIQISKEQKDEWSKTIAQSELALNWIFLNEYEKARRISEVVLANEKAAVKAKIMSYQNLAKIVAKTKKDLKREFDYYHKALRVANEATLENSGLKDSLFVSNKSQAFKGLAHMHRNRKDYDSSYYYLDLISTLTQSLRPTNRQDLISNKIDLIVLYFTQKKELSESKRELDITQKLVDELVLKNQLDFNLAIRYYNLLGVYYSRMRQNDSSLIANKKQEQLVSASPRVDFTLLAQLQSNIGRKYYVMGDYNTAFEYERKAFKQKKQILSADDPSLASSYKWLGVYRITQAQAANEAIEYFEEALRINKKNFGTNHPQTVDALHNLSYGLNAAGKYSLSLEQSREALRVQKAINGYDYTTAAIYTALADNLIALDSLEEAISTYKQLIKLVNKAERDMSNILVKAESGIGFAYYELGQYTFAEEYFRKAEGTSIKVYGANDYGLASIYNGLTQALQKQQRINEALEINKKAIKVNSYDQKLFNIDPVPLNLLVKIQILFIDSHILRLQLLLQNSLETESSSLEGFWNTFERTIGLIESWMSEQTNRADIVALLSFNKTLHSIGIDALSLSSNSTHGMEKALRMWNFSERSKAVHQKLAERRRQVDYPLASTPKLLEKQREVDDAISHYKSLILNGNDHDSVEAGLFKALQAKKDSEQELKTKFPKDYLLTHFESDVTHEQAKNFLKDDQNILDYFITKENLYVFVINTDSIHSFKFDWSLELQKEVSRLNDLVKNDSTRTFESVSSSIYGKIFKPLEGAIKGKNIIIVPDGKLWNLNFDLLVTNSQATKREYLIQKYAISYAYSSALLFNKDYPRKPKRQVLAFAYAGSELKEPQIDNLRDAPKENLPGTAKELKDLEGSLKGKFFYGKKATEHEFKKSAPDYSILHLALHGEVSDEDPENSRLHFSKNTEATSEDNALHNFELYDMKLNADLAVLSACNTGTGKISNGEGVMSLGKAFRYAGVNSVLLSQWEVSDATAPVIMNSFYKNLKNGLTKPEALRQAKLEFLENSNNITSNPYYWGSFFIIGNPDPINLNPKSNQWYWVVGLLMLVTLIIYRKRMDLKTST